MTRHELARWTLRHVALPMAQTSQVEERLTAILQPKRRQAMLTTKTITVAALATAAIIAPLAALRPVAQAQAQAQAGLLPQAEAIGGWARSGNQAETFRWGRGPGHPQETVAQMHRLYRYMVTYRQRHGTFPQSPQEGIGLLLGDMGFHPSDYGLPNQDSDRALRAASHALANPDVRLTGYRGDPDSAGVYIAEHPVGMRSSAAGTHGVLAWTSLYMHAGQYPTGAYLVLWDDGLVEAVPASRVLFAPLSEDFLPVPAARLNDAVRSGAVNWVPCFPGEVGVPAEAMTPERYWQVQIERSHGPA